MSKRGVVKNLIREGLEAKKRKARADMTALVASHPLPLIPEFYEIIDELETRLVASSSDYEQIYYRVVIAHANKDAQMSTPLDARLGNNFATGLSLTTHFWQVFMTKRLQVC